MIVPVPYQEQEIVYYRHLLHTMVESNSSVSAAHHVSISYSAITLSRKKQHVCKKKKTNIKVGPGKWSNCNQGCVKGQVLKRNLPHLIVIWLVEKVASEKFDLPVDQYCIKFNYCQVQENQFSFSTIPIFNHLWIIAAIKVNKK